jgi:hypothetical protein
MYRRLDGETAWTQDHGYYRPDLPATLQAGVVVNGWQSDSVELRGRFDYVRYASVATVADCTSDHLTLR